jgi:hypothetical protein
MTEDIPNSLLRDFGEPQYVERFIARGEFRLGKLQLYRNTEVKNRADLTEGFGYYRDENGIHENFEFGGHIYLLSLATLKVDIDYLKNKMGGSVVCINSVEQFMLDIHEYLMSNGYPIFGSVKGRFVQYNKGGVISDELDEMDRAILSIAQKPEYYSQESEYRLFVIINHRRCTKPLHDYIDINLGKKLDYAELIS